jgi:hypothetical protein
MRATRMFLIAAVAATYSHAAFAQHGDFTPKVQLILDYLKDSGDTCISPAIPGEQPFNACREDTGSIALTIVTGLPVRDGDGRVIDTCSAKLTATIVPGLQSVKMEVSAGKCPEKTRKSGEFSRIFVGVILELAEWVQKKGKPI